MRHRRIPLLVVALSLGWLAAQALDRPELAAIVVVTSIWAACSVGARPQARLLRWWLRLLAAGLGVTLSLLLFRPLAGAASLAVMLALIAAAGVLVPLVYAATFDSGADPP